MQNNKFIRGNTAWALVSFFQKAQTQLKYHILEER